MEFIPYTNEFRDAALAIFDSNVPDFVGAEEREGLIFFLEKEVQDIQYFVLKTEGEIIGMCGYVFEKEKNEAVLCWGLVHRSFHRKKTGTKMLEFRINQIKKHSPGTKIICRTSQVTEGFFAKFGFKTIEEKENYWSDGLHLRKMILDA